MNGYKDLVGQRFGRLVVLEPKRLQKTGRTAWICICDCGNTRVVTTGHLNNGNTKSCGCFHIDRSTKHGHSHKSTHNIWKTMTQRCFNENSYSYRNYGARGIKVCDRWLGDDGFVNFLNDMGERPSGKTLDRYPGNDGDYEPSNCRWATAVEQAANRRPRTGRFNENDIRLIRSIEINTKSLALILGVDYSTIFRIRSGEMYAYVA